MRSVLAGFLPGGTAGSEYTCGCVCVCVCVAVGRCSLLRYETRIPSSYNLCVVYRGSFLRQVAPRETGLRSGLGDQSALHRGRVQRRAAQRNIELPKEDKGTDIRHTKGWSLRTRGNTLRVFTNLALDGTFLLRMPTWRLVDVRVGGDQD